MKIPDDLQAAIDAEPKAKEMLAKLSAQNRFALAFRTHNMKTEAGRKKKIADLRRDAQARRDDLPAGQEMSFARHTMLSKAITETADSDARNPREYHTRRCNGDRLIALAAEPLPPVRRPRQAADHRTRLRLQDRNRRPVMVLMRAGE